VTPRPRGPCLTSSGLQVALFKAQPLPSFDSVLLPEKKTLEPTRPEPFRLLGDQRGALRSALREQQVPPARDPPPEPRRPP